MGRFLRCLASRILMTAAVVLLFVELGIHIRIVSSPPLMTSTTTTTNGSNLDSHLSTTTKLLSVEALSLKRPPRIRPRKQSPVDRSDEASYSSQNGSVPTKNTPNTQHAKEDIFLADQRQTSMASKHEQALKDPSLLTTIEFADRADLHRHTKEALADGFGIRTMTLVQAATYDAALEGRSVLARSKTGSGKTLAFLLPTLERILDPDDLQYGFGNSIGCVVLAPTRELAIQIADQAEILVGYHNRHRQKPQLRVACIYGGVKMQRDVRQITGDSRGSGMGDLPTILVSTPSRLLEHLEGNSPLNKSFKSSYGQPHNKNSKLAGVLANTKIVVLDETDRLLQKSNRQETQKVLGYLARPEKRQTLMFSATVPRTVRRFLSNSSILGKPKKSNRDDDDRSNKDFLEVDCIGMEEGINESESNTHTMHSDSGNSGIETESSNQNRIEESFVVLQNMSQFATTLLTIIRREQQRDNQNYKILVFFPAGRLVRFLYQFFVIGGLESSNHLWEIHSRMSQSSRTRSSNAFRNSKKGILFSSDVSARGLDYPGVSLVVQMGAPSTDQDYVHRIGRTGRAGTTGRSLLVLLPFESNHIQPKKSSSPKRKPSSKANSYRDDINLREDLQLASWLREQLPETNDDDEEHLSLYQTCQKALKPTLSKVRSGHVVLTPGAQASYKTFLAHYAASNKNSSRNNKNSNVLSSFELLLHAKDFVEGSGLSRTPQLEDDFASKLGLPKEQR